MKEVNDIQPSTSTDSNRPNNDIKNRKRRASCTTENDVSAKRFIAQEEDDGDFKLLDFTDEVLLEILQNCDSMTLYALSKTCKHFLKLVEDRRLWKTFDFSTKKLMGRQIKKLLSTLQIADILEFKVRGFISKYPLEKWKNNTITPHMLRKLSSSCLNLDTMEIREGYINFQQIKIADFPSTLKRLIFYACQIAMPRSPRLFQKIDEHLQLLEEISLEKCPWFETHDLVIFSKLPHLKRLILRGCESLKGCVPYGSIATRFGFRSLEYLDVRDTPITDSDIQCFNITSTLREILMDCPVGLRAIDSDASTVEASDDDDGDKKDSNDGNHKYRPIAISDTESSSESEDDSDCSSDSEDGNSDDEDGAAKASGSNEEGNAPQAHCIQVILQNGRMINVNAERSNEHENAVRGPNALRCVIGIINGRDSNDPFVSSHRIVATSRHQRAPSNQSDESNAQAAKGSTDPPSNPEPMQKSPEKSESNKNESTENAEPAPVAVAAAAAIATADSSGEAGPSGLQTNQNESTKAPKSNSSDSNENANDEAGPSNRNAPNPPIIEPRQRLIIVQHRRHPSNDENGNMHRHISWEVRNVYPIADAPYRHERYQNTMLNGNGNYITDRGMCSFGMPRRNVQEGIIWIRAELRPPDTLLERITVRNYFEVTDVTLRHLALCAPNLRYLDVTGTSVTRRGITTFLKEKPECQVISELLDT